jgi:hypothetical protein
VSTPRIVTGCFDCCHGRLAYPQDRSSRMKFEFAFRRHLTWIKSRGGRRSYFSMSNSSRAVCGAECDCFDKSSFRFLHAVVKCISFILEATSATEK